MSDQTREQRLRQEILDKVGEYYREIHQPEADQEFQPGVSRVPYGGRVYDEKEMVNLVDSALEFWLTSGRYTDQFEKELARNLGVKHALFVNSGSSANLLAMKALTSPLLKDKRVNPGDEVITVAAGFPTTVTPIFEAGACPVFLDVNLEDGTYNLNVSQLEEALSNKTKAVMVAHTLGNPMNLSAVTEFCESNGLWFVEDNCDALGSTYEGKATGSFGDLATSSFYPPHHITTGEGGAVYTSDGLLKRIVESFRDWGRDCWCPPGKDNTCKKRFDWDLGELPKGYDHKYIFRHFGFNLKSTDMQAAIGCAQIDKLDQFTKARRNNWQKFRSELSDLEDLFVLPNPTPGSDPSWFGFVLTVRESSGLTRDQIVSRLESRNIQTRMLFAGNLIRHPLFDEIRNTSAYRVIGDLRNTDRIMNQTFWFGIYPGLNESMLDCIIDTLRVLKK